MKWFETHLQLLSTHLCTPRVDVFQHVEADQVAFVSSNSTHMFNDPLLENQGALALAQPFGAWQATTGS